MEDWADALRIALSDFHKPLVQSLGLPERVSGVEFEEIVGAFLAWQKTHGLLHRFKQLGHPAGHVDSGLESALHHFEQSAVQITEVLNQTLYDEFGSGRVDEDAAARGYSGLLRALAGPDSLTLVTTNYDAVAELAFDELGWHLESGFVGRASRTPVLRPEGMIDRAEGRSNTAAIVHLHGAVGWYEKGRQVLRHAADQPFNGTLGVPVVLYPDPDKDPSSVSLVEQLWAEFDDAIARADAIVVIGHSLHDPTLVDRLRAASDAKPLGVGILPLEGEDDQLLDSEELEWFEGILPSADRFPLRFGPPETAYLGGLQAWAETVAGNVEASAAGKASAA